MVPAFLPSLYTPADITRGQRATPIAFVQAIVQAYDRYGLDPANALAQACINTALLDDASSRITARQFEMVCSVAMQELDDEALGWFTRRLRWGSYGMLSRASLTAPNLGVAIKRWCRHHQLLIDDIALTPSTAKSIAQISIVEHSDLGSTREFCLLSTLRYLLGYACWVIDARIPCIELTLPFAAPPHSEVYGLLFDGHIRFNAKHASLRFDAAYLGMPLRRDEQALQQMLKRALPLTVLQYRKDTGLAQRVYHVLNDQPNKLLTAELLAQHLHVSTRTLHRQLKDEGTSLQHIKDEVRKKRAINLLLRTERPIKQIATASGFDNDKSFTRAFSRWTGTAPSEFRMSRRATGKQVLNDHGL